VRIVFKFSSTHSVCCITIHTKVLFLHIEGSCGMRTNIEIDDRLMTKAMKSSGSRTKRATVESALRLLIQTRAQKSIRALRGKVKWTGNLELSRRGRAG